MKLALLFIFFLTSIARAETKIPWEKLELIGSGCPAGNVEKKFSSTQPQLLQIKFFQFALREQQKRKACQLVLPVSLAANEQLQLESFLIHGEAKFGAKNSALQVRSENFVARESNKAVIAQTLLMRDGKFNLKSPPLALGPCGLKDNVRFNISALSKGNAVTATVQEAAIGLKVVPCK